MTPIQGAEVEAFAAFVIARRNLNEPQVLTCDVPIEELLELVARSGSFDRLGADEEDIYSIEAGEEVRWSTSL